MEHVQTQPCSPTGNVAQHLVRGDSYSSLSTIGYNDLTSFCHTIKKVKNSIFHNSFVDNFARIFVQLFLWIQNQHKIFWDHISFYC
jgi:hypothetical protein